MSQLSISLVTFQSDLPLLNKTINSLVSSVQYAKQSGSVSEARLYIVDNGNQREEILSILSAIPYNIMPSQYVASPFNGGFGQGHNQALMLDHAEYQIVLNPDLIIAPDALETGIRFMEANPDVAAVGAPGKDGNGSPAYLAKRHPTLAVLALRYLPFARRIPAWRRRLNHYEYRDMDPSPSGPHDVELLSGCFMILRKPALVSEGGFDPRYFLYFEDYDLCRRLQATGRLVLHPDVGITHFGGKTPSKGVNHTLYFIRSMVAYFNRWGWRFL